MSIERFTIEIPDAVLEDLHRRLARTRCLALDSGDDWSAGTSPAYLREFVAYWMQGYNWRDAEAALNRLPNYRATINGAPLHFLHERGAGDDALPIVLTHGYPDSFLRFEKLIPWLTNPEQYGGSRRDAFDVIVPSLPGFAFSGLQADGDGIFGVGAVFHELMTKHLGYSRYCAHGGDWGSLVTEQLARDYRDSVIGIHLTDVPFWHGLQPPDDLIAPEEKFFAETAAWLEREGAYITVQGTRPQSLADGLADSPVGLAAWILEKFQRWSDCGGNIENRFTKDELITNIMLYWVTNTVGSSFLPYYDMTHAGTARWLKEKARAWIGASHVPAAFAIFPGDIAQPPRRWAERFFNVERFTYMPRGGHFAALEEPELLAADIREFFRPFRVIRAE